MTNPIDTLSVDRPWLMLGDCLERMKEIPDGSIDAIICDLPYATTACHWDKLIPLEPLWTHYRRIIKGNGAIVLTASQPFTSALVMSNLKQFRYAWVWDKRCPTNFMSAKWMPLLRTEDICVFSRATCNAMSKTRIPYHPQGLRVHGRVEKNSRNRGGRVAADRRAVFEHGKEFFQEFTGYPQNVLEFPVSRGNIHPTQKPVALFEYLIRTYTQPGEVVLDNCFGSATTGVACVNTGRRFIGIEKHEPYFNLGRRRIEATIAASQPAPQGGLFDAVST